VQPPRGQTPAVRAPRCAASSVAWRREIRRANRLIDCVRRRAGEGTEDGFPRLEIRDRVQREVPEPDASAILSRRSGADELERNRDKR
jgi:hypothetical protein